MSSPARRSEAPRCRSLAADDSEGFPHWRAALARPDEASGPTWCLPYLRFLPLLSHRRAAQTTGKTVRHHKVEVEDPSSPPELIQAESAIEKKDYATAEPLLKKVVADDPQNFAAWFDLGFHLQRTGQNRRRHCRLPQVRRGQTGVFESNLNLGLTLVKAGQPDAEAVSARRHQAETHSARSGRSGAGLAVPGPCARDHES